MTHNGSGTIANAVVTAFVAVLPEAAFGYATKLLSVFVLAAVAEGGRRLVAWLLERRKK